MAITDTRPEVAAPADAPEFTTSPNTVFGSGDHTTLGRLWIGAALLLGIAGWVVNAIVGVNQIGDGDLLSAEAASTMFTLGRTGLVLLVVVPLLLGIATLVVPLQVGANTIAFPRAAAFAFWAWLLSGGVLIVANTIDGGFGGGRIEAVDMMLASLLGLVLALVVATVCVLTTAITLRTPGMSLDRVPATTWATLVGGSMWLLTLPVLAGNVVLIYLDHRYGRPSDFGVAANQWAQVSWLVGQPQIYAFVIPGLGILTDVVTTLAGVRQANRGFVLVGIGAFGVLSFGAYAQPYFYPDVADQAVWAGMSLLIVLPVLLLIGAWAATLKAGRPPLKAAVGVAGVAILLLLLAVVAGALYVITPLDLRLSGDFASGHFAVVVAAGIAMGIAGLYYWAPKLIGRFANEALGKLSVLLLLGGGALAGLPLMVLGFANRFDGLADAADALNGIAVAGSVLMALAILVAIGALATAPKDETPADDAWGTGQTLEWATASPPVPGNFGELARVRSAEPVLDPAEPSQEA
jgi:heme/copper-type cytochrome/quinol oxidase subunit 1